MGGPTDDVVMTTPEAWPLGELRDHAIRRAKGICEWPDCPAPGEQMAHFQHRGMGGSKNRNVPDNVAWLCHHHHLTLDLEKPIRRFELRELLKFALSR